MSIPFSTYLSMSLYLLANQWVAATDLRRPGWLGREQPEREQRSRETKRRLGKDNAEAQRALRFAEKKEEISPQSARRAQSPRGETRISAEGHRRFYQGWRGVGRRWRRGCCWDAGEKSHTLRARRRMILWRRWGRLLGTRAEPRSWSGLASCGPGAQH